MIIRKNDKKQAMVPVYKTHKTKGRAIGTSLKQGRNRVLRNGQNIIYYEKRVGHNYKYNAYVNKYKKY